MTPNPAPPVDRPSLPLVPPTAARIAWAVLVFHLALSPLLFSTATVEAFEENKTALLTATALVLASLGVFALGRKLSFLPPGTGLLNLIRTGLGRLRSEPVTLGLILWTASAVFSTVFSLSPHTSWRGAADSHAGLKTILGYLTLFLATRQLCGRVRDGRRLLAAAVFAGVVTSTYALVQFARLDPVHWAKLSIFAGQPRPFGTLGHANHLGAYLAMSLPFTVVFAGRALRRRRWLALAILAAGGALALPVVFITLSRGAWLATVAMSLVLAATWRRRSAGQVSGRLRVAGVTLLGLTTACGIALPLGAPDRVFRSSLAERLRHLNSASGRWQIWHASWDLFRDRPLTGCGVDTFRLAFGSRRPPEFGRVEWDLTPTRAHNELLHALATQGLPGAVALLVLIAGLVWAGRRAWRRARPPDRPFLVALLASLTAFGVQALFNFTVAGYGTLFVTCAAVLSRWGEDPSPTPSAAPLGGRTWAFLLGAAGAVALLAAASSAGFAGANIWLALAGVGGLTAWALARVEGGALAPRVPSVRRDFPGSACRAFSALACAVGCAALLWVEVVRPVRASRACRAGDLLLYRNPENARASYQEALALDPGADRYWVRLSSAEQFLARQAPAAEQRAAWGRAEDALERALALVAVDSFHRASRAQLWGELACVGLALPGPARAEWDAVLTLDPYHATFLAEAARTALSLGNYARCRDLATRGLSLYPTFGLLHAYLGQCAYAEGQLADALPHLRQAVRADWHGDEDGLTRALATLAATHLGLGQLDRARARAAEAAERQPDWPTPRRLIAEVRQRLAARRGATSPSPSIENP